MHPLLKDAFKIQIETGASIKQHFGETLAALSRCAAQIEVECPAFRESPLRADYDNGIQDLADGIQMLEMLCGEMQRLFQFVPENDACPEPESVN